MDYIFYILGFIGLVIVGIAIVRFVSSRESDEEEKLPYRLKQKFFSDSEHEFFRLLNLSLDHEKYALFPKVRLADIVEVVASREEYQGALNRIKSKHFDYLIWDIFNNEMALAIELDGSSHKNQKVIESDEFKNKLCSDSGIKLIRVHVGSSFIDEVEKIELSLQ